MAFENWYEPYERTQAYLTFPDAEKLLRKVFYYLLDMPTGTHAPFEDNRCPRVRLVKRLFWDDARPLDQRIPTPEEKLSIIYDPEKPDAAPTLKGYRMFPQMAVLQAQEKAQTRINAFMGYAQASNPFKSELSVVFRTLCNTSYDSNTKDYALSRSWAITSDIMAALAGLNMGVGVGTFYFDRKQNSECGIRYITDDAHNVGYQLVMGLTIMGDKLGEMPIN